jgi:hypothetical protein
MIGFLLSLPPQSAPPPEGLRVLGRPRAALRVGNLRAGKPALGRTIGKVAATYWLPSTQVADLLVLLVLHLEAVL